MTFIEKKLQGIISLWSKKVRMGVKVIEVEETLVFERAWR